MELRIVKESNDYKILVNGEYEKLWDHREEENREDFCWEPEPGFFLNKLTGICGEKIPNGLLFLSSYQSENYSFLASVTLFRRDDIIYGTVHCLYDWSQWESFIKMDRFLELFALEITRIPEIKVNVDNENWGTYIDIDIDFTLSIHEEFVAKVESIARNLSAIHVEVEQKLLRKVSNNHLLTIFNFPEDYKHICCQYLAYFGEFLKDIGISSKLSIEAQAEYVCLSVEPQDKDEAIRNIYNALLVYLSLPSEKSAGVLSPSNDQISMVKHQQLLAVIDHLKSQLRLKDAMLLAQNVQFCSTHTSNDHNIFLDSIESVRTKNQEELSLLNGGVKITEYKGSFFTINVPRIINSFRSWLGNK